MILHCCDNRKMQDQNLVEIHSGAEVSSQSVLKPLSTETSAISPSENSCGTDVHCLNQNGIFDESSELEMIQKSLPIDECGDKRVFEASLESPETSLVESSSSWGDFEGFSEVKENLSNTLESLEKPNEKQTYTYDADVIDSCPTTSCGQFFSKTTGHNRKETFANTSVKAVLSSEDIIKLSFPEVPVPQFLEKISSLDQVLYTKTEDADIPECTKKPPCTDSGNLLKTLIQSTNPSSLRRPWNESHHQENLLAVLGIDAHQKAVPEGKNDVLETSISENEDSNIDKFNISTCKALIQTKLSVSPAPKQSHLFSYNLFLKKTPSVGNMQYITVPQKKRIFTTRSLKMKMFSSNVC